MRVLRLGQVKVAIASDTDNENADSGDDNELAFSVSDSRFVQDGNVFTAQQGFYVGEYLVNVRVFDRQRTDYQKVNISVTSS